MTEKSYYVSRVTLANLTTDNFKFFDENPAI